MLGVIEPVLAPIPGCAECGPTQQEGHQAHHLSQCHLSPVRRTAGGNGRTSGCCEPNNQVTDSRNRV